MKKWAAFLIGIVAFGVSQAAAAPARSLMENLSASNTSFYLNTSGRYGVVGSTARVGGSTATWTVGGNVKAQCVEFATGTYQCAPASTTADIDAVTAGYGLTGGGTSGSVTLNLNGATTSYIQNRDTLQANTTAFPEILKTSSATITDATILRSTSTNLTTGNVNFTQAQSSSTWNHLTANNLTIGSIVRGVKIIQMFSFTQTTTSATSNTAGFVPTTISTGTTPASTSSKFLLIATPQCRATGTSLSNSTLVSLARGSTDLSAGGTGMCAIIPNVNSQPIDNSCAIVKIDSPATTSPVTYTVTFRTNTASNTINCPVNGIDGTLTVVEFQ